MIKEEKERKRKGEKILFMVELSISIG